MERKLSVNIYASAFLLTVAMFAMAILASWVLNAVAFLWVGGGISDISSKATYLNTIILMEENTTTLCPAYDQRISDISGELETTGYELTYLEYKKQASDPNITAQYFSLEAESYGLSEKVKALCGDNSTLVIDFYSANCTSCSAQDTEIFKARDALVSQGGAARLFYFDINNSEAGPLVERYNVTAVPTVVINGQPYPGFLNATELTGLMGGRP
jgi:thiol:disulfide interchange protein